LADASSKQKVAAAANTPSEAKIQAARTAVDGAARAGADAPSLRRLRAIAFWATATVLGTAVSAGMKLYFLERVGIANSSRWWEVLATGLIGAGTKPLHDLIEYISAKKEGTKPSGDPS
jgi:hypothetical protein